MDKVFRCDCDGVSEWVVAKDIESARKYLNEEHDFEFLDSEENNTKMYQLTDRQIDELTFLDLSEDDESDDGHPSKPARFFMNKEKSPYSLGSTEF